MGKRLLLLPIVAGIMALGLGAAAGLDITGGTLQQGNASATCDADGVDVAYTLDGTNAATVEITGIDAACDDDNADADITILLLDATNGDQDSGLLNIASAATTASFDIADVPIADVDGVTVTLN